MATRVRSRDSNGQKKKREKGITSDTLRDREWKKALARHRKCRAEGTQKRIENFHPTEMVLEENGGGGACE